MNLRSPSFDSISISVVVAAVALNAIYCCAVVFQAIASVSVQILSFHWITPSTYRMEEQEVQSRSTCHQKSINKYMFISYFCILTFYVYIYLYIDWHNLSFVFCTHSSSPLNPLILSFLIWKTGRKTNKKPVMRSNGHRHPMRRFGPALY